MKGYVDRSLPASSVEGRYHRCIKRKVLGNGLEHLFPLSSAKQKQLTASFMNREELLLFTWSQIERSKVEMLVYYLPNR